MNPNRIEYLDYARGFAVLTMFLQHCMIVHESNQGEATPLGMVFVILGTAPAAPVFLLLMGVFLVRSRSSLSKMMKRGVILVGAGYLLNLIRLTIPLLLAGEADYKPGDSPLENLFAVDILQTAGLSIIVGSVLRRYSPKWSYGLLAFIVPLIAPLLWRFEPLSSPFNLLWGTAPQVHFPLFPWLFYPLAGMAISDYLVDKSHVLRSGLRIMGGIGVLCLVCILLLFVTPIGDYMRSGAGVHVGIFAFILLWFRVLVRLERGSFKHSCMAKILVFWSMNVTSMYCVQWILFGWSILLFGASRQSDYIAALIGLGILLITHNIIKHTCVRKWWHAQRT